MALTHHLTELQTHFGPASECEGAEKEDEVDEEEAEFAPVLVPHADDSGTAADPAHCAVSTLHSAHSQEHQRPHHHLGAQLGRLKQETNRYVRTETCCAGDLILEPVRAAVTQRPARPTGSRPQLSIMTFYSIFIASNNSFNASFSNLS